MDSSRRSSSRLKDRLARMFRSPSLLRSTCNTSASATPAASRYLINDAALEDDDDSVSLGLGRTLSFPGVVGRRRLLSIGCRLGDHYPLPPQTPKTVTVGKDEEGAPASSCFDKAMEEDEVDRKRRKKKKKMFLSNAYGFSSSSPAESEDDDGDGDGSGGFFSSEDDEEGGEQKKEEDETATETTFLSSRSFSSDSSEFYQNPKNQNKNNKPHHLPARRRIDRTRRKAQHDSGWGVCRGLHAAPAAAPAAAAEHGREVERRKRGFAVVKRSSDPYNDFRSSMLEMIMERQIFGAGDLQNLLRSYLCLNSPHLHLVILQAFSDIWVVLFGH